MTKTENKTRGIQDYNSFQRNNSEIGQNAVQDLGPGLKYL